MINIQKDKNGLIIVIFLYNPQFVQKIKTAYEYKWNPDGTLEKILNVFR